MNGSKKRSAGAAASDEQPREIELKLDVPAERADALLTHSALTHAHFQPDQSGRLHAVYYDTGDQSLRRAGISLRIRRTDGHAVQTVKADRKAHGMALNRGEWEIPVEGSLDFAAIAKTPLGSLLSDEKARTELKPLFTVETERKTFEIERDEALIEVSLDRTEVSAAGHSTRFVELELELKQGEPGALFTLARDLGTAAPLRLALIPKSERGYRLLEEVSPRPFRAEAIELPENASCAEAFRIIARSCLAQTVRNEALVRQTRDPKALHQMRVGMRRLRAALSLFKNQLLADPESAEIKDALRSTSRALGDARDLDVLLERLGSKADYAPSDLKAVQQRREAVYRTLHQTLEAPEFMALILRTAAWIEAGTWGTGSEQGQAKARSRSARDFAAHELSRRWKRIRKLAKHLRDIDDRERHELRIRIKKLRYGAEFFGPLFASDKALKRRERLSDILEDLQELLGRLNDLSVGHSLVPSLSAISPACIDERRGKLLDKAEAAARELDDAKPFWR